MALWTPELIDTALWLDAADESTLTLDDSGNVEQWADKSGNGRDATGTSRPSLSNINSIPALLFNNNQLTVFHKVALNGTTGLSIFLVFQSSQTTTNTGPIGKWSTAQSWVVPTRRWDGVNGVSFNTPNGASPQSPHVNNGTGRILSGVFVPNGAIHHWIDGNGNNSSAMGAAPTGTSHITIGNLYGSDSGAGRFVGQIGEVVICGASLSTEARQSIEGYLAHKWGLEANLPAEHPYKTDAPLPKTVSGIITDEDGTPVQRKVYAMSRPTDSSAPVLLAHGLSDPTTGAYELALGTDAEVTRIVVAEDEDEPGPGDPVLPDRAHRIIPG